MKKCLLYNVKKSVPSSSNEELKSVSVVSIKFESIGCENTIASIILSIGNASRDVFALFVISVNATVWFSAFWFLN